MNDQTRTDLSGNTIEFGKETMMVLVFGKLKDGTIGIFGATDITGGKLVVNREYLAAQLVGVTSELNATGGRALIVRALTDNDVGNKVQELLKELSDAPVTTGAIANKYQPEDLGLIASQHEKFVQVPKDIFDSALSGKDFREEHNGKIYIFTNPSDNKEVARRIGDRCMLNLETFTWLKDDPAYEPKIIPCNRCGDEPIYRYMDGVQMLQCTSCAHGSCSMFNRHHVIKVWNESFGKSENWEKYVAAPVKEYPTFEQVYNSPTQTISLRETKINRLAEQFRAENERKAVEYHKRLNEMTDAELEREWEMVNK